MALCKAFAGLNWRLAFGAKKKERWTEAIQRSINRRAYDGGFGS
jgi:hypothetical protein